VIRFVWFVSHFASLRGSYALLIREYEPPKPHETHWKSHNIDHSRNKLKLEL